MGKCTRGEADGVYRLAQLHKAEFQRSDDVLPIAYAVVCIGLAKGSCQCTRQKIWVQKLMQDSCLIAALLIKHLLQ